MNEEVEKVISGFVRGNLFPSYDFYCPLIELTGYLQENGRYLVSYDADESVELEKNDIIPCFGVLIVQLGGIEKDLTLESAANALFHSLDSLFSACDDSVVFECFRTTVELSEYMKVYRCNFSHIVIIGHGSTDGIQFLDKQKPIAGSELGGLLGSDFHSNKITIISLCCHSGCRKLSSGLSTAAGVCEVIAPSETFDLRWSVHFITGLFLSLYISGDSIDIAVEKANVQVDGGDMCVWRGGSLVNC